MSIPAGNRCGRAVISDGVFLLDVDNTLLDGDRIVNDLRACLKGAFGVVDATFQWLSPPLHKSVLQSIACGTQQGHVASSLAFHTKRH